MPVGRRLAFNGETGRFWVVCGKCERWNLSPLESRWEAIEACERAYSATRKRVSTDNIALARVPGGVDLIRIGRPLRPEFAAWRYGDQFGRRRRRQLAATGAVAGAVGAVVVGGIWVGVSVASFGGLYSNAGLWDRIVHGSPNAGVATVIGADGAKLDVRRRHARMAALKRPADGSDGFSLLLPHMRGTTLLTGDLAARAAQQVLPTVNRFGGSKRAVASAVSLLEDSGGPEAALLQLAKKRGSRDDVIDEAYKSSAPEKLDVGHVLGALHRLETPERLALEMALHEESERRAMAGELGALEAAWRAAEEIAGIADTLLEPAGLPAKLDALRERSERLVHERPNGTQHTPAADATGRADSPR